MFDYLRPVMVLMTMYFFLDTNCYFSFKKNNALCIKSLKNKLNVSLYCSVRHYHTKPRTTHVILNFFQCMYYLSYLIENIIPYNN